ncbi:hypothetical protein TNCV_1243411 [Trichonephila clavipes]|nr:hypothetical protein TNCV_1243411 [Trichonephila clavipes]
MQRAENIRQPMNLKPTYEFNLFATKFRAIARRNISTRTQSYGSVGVENDTSIAYPVLSREVLIINIYSPFQSVWEKIHNYAAGIAVIAFSSYSDRDVIVHFQ